MLFQVIFLLEVGAACWKSLTMKCLKIEMLENFRIYFSWSM